MVGCAKRNDSFDLNAYQTEIEKWKERRLAGLTREDGWLTLCGFFWLKDGENRFGTDSSNQIILPKGKAPKVAGSLWLENGVVRVKVQKGAKVTSKGQQVTSMVLLSDEDGLKDLDCAQRWHTELLSYQARGPACRESEGQRESPTLELQRS